MSLSMGNNDRKLTGDRYLGAFKARSKDRGRKYIDDGSHYKTADFIHDSHSDIRSPTHAPIQITDTRHTKFKTGFYRRHVSNMDVTSKRVSEEKRRSDRFTNHAPRRLGNIVAFEQRNGNIVANAPADSIPKYRPYRHIKQVESGKAENENTKRQMKDPTSRFHALITSEARERHRQRRELIQRGLNPASSDIGVGRRDIASNGVADNFNFPAHKAKMSRISRYGRAQVDSKARYSNFHIGEQGRSTQPTREPTPAPQNYSRNASPAFNASSSSPYITSSAAASTNRFL